MLLQLSDISLQKIETLILICRSNFLIVYTLANIRFTLGLPGTGLFVTEHVSYKRFKNQERKQIDTNITYRHL